jgi:tRNA1(Val) A37 N6-methylase TrmN6
LHPDSPSACRPAANRVLAAFVKSRKRALEILPPLIVHDHNGYTPQLREILKIS